MSRETALAADSGFILVEEKDDGSERSKTNQRAIEHWARWVRLFRRLPIERWARWVRLFRRIRRLQRIWAHLGRYLQELGTPTRDRARLLR